MKGRVERMARIMNLAATEERKVAVLAGKSQAQLNTQRERLGELNAHRQTYLGRSQGVDYVAAAHWKDYQRFMVRLDQAVRSQTQVIKDCEKSVETYRRRWRVKRQRLDSLQQVLERYEQDERVAADRREQRVLDDMPASRLQFGHEADF